jgi:hypothetical protein
MTRPLAALFATLAWVTLGTQFLLSIRTALGTGGSVWDGVVSYFGFFTVLTNLFCATILLAHARRPRPSERRGTPPQAVVWDVLMRPGVMTTAATAIIIVGVVYHLVLADLWNPRGINLAVDTMLHTVLPVAYVLFWWLAVPRGAITWREVPLWLVYPGAYAVYVFARGALIADYPYPFIDVAQIGYAAAVRNSVGIALVFAAVAAALVGVNRVLGGKGGAG